jgi:Outer membrane protein beta-barrel domain
MKIFSFVCALFLVATTTVFGQYHLNFPPDLNWEIGLNGGFSVCTRPVGPPDAYRGTRTNVVPDFSIRGGYSFNQHWQMNLDIGSRLWETFGTWQINGTYGQSLGNQNISFMLAQRAVSESIQFNYVIPFYTHFQVYNKANLYFGAMFGAVTTVNDGSETISKYKSPVDSSSTNFVSKVDYNSGIGYSMGVQTGFSYFFVPKLGINVEFAVRYANITTSDINNGGELSRYRLLYFPETIGIRYRF